MGNDKNARDLEAGRRGWRCARRGVTADGADATPRLISNLRFKIAEAEAPPMALRETGSVTADGADATLRWISDLRFQIGEVEHRGLGLLRDGELDRRWRGRHAALDLKFEISNCRG